MPQGASVCCQAAWWATVSGQLGCCSSACEHEPPDAAGDLAFEAAHGLFVGLALADLAVVVAAALAVGHADLGHRDEVQRRVELAVAAAREPVAGSVRRWMPPRERCRRSWRTRPRSGTVRPGGSGR